MNELEVPFGLRVTDRRMVSIEAVERGLACGCTCPGCGAQLVGVKGEVKIHHFRHHSEDVSCTGARETALHLFAKQIICEEIGSLALPGAPEVYLRLEAPVSAVSEPYLDGIRPDVLAHYAEDVAIEVYVTHRVPMEKVREIHRRELCTLEIDLSYHRYLGLTEYNLRQAVLEHASRRWIYEPRYLREIRAEALAELNRKADQAKAEAVERVRLAQLERERAIREDDARREAWRLEQAEQQEQLAIAAAELAERRRVERAKQAELDALRRAEEEQRRAERAPPDLQALVLAHAVYDADGKMIGGYDRITPETWATFDARMKAWKDRLAVGTFVSGKNVA